MPDLQYAVDKLLIGHFREEGMSLAAQEVIECLRKVEEEVAQNRQARCWTTGVELSFIMIFIIGDQAATIPEESRRLCAMHCECVSVHGRRHPPTQ